jgi:protein-L-isoaspartate(D-aspartate) O-methyltransferase
MEREFEKIRENLIQRLVDEGILRTPAITKAMRLVRREDFVPKEARRHAYVDAPLPIGYGQTISAPQDQ